MSMVTAMDGIGDVNHVDTVHDDINPDYKQTMEKVMEKQEETLKVQEPVTEVRPLTEEEQSYQMPETSLNREKPTNIWLQFNTVSVGWTEDGKPTATYDIVELMNGLVALGHAVSVQFANPQPEEKPVEENATDDIEEVKQEAKWQHNGQPENPTTNE